MPASRIWSSLATPLLDSGSRLLEAGSPCKKPAGESRIVGPRTHRLPSNLLGPRAHRLPSRVMWAITILTALGVAFLNFGSVLLIQTIARWKFALVQLVIQQTGTVHAGIGVLILLCTGFAVFMVCLIELIAPNCGGSGIPENKTYLNGGSMPNLFTKRTMWVRAATNVLANVAGFPVGREGPMVTMGSNIAFLTSKWLALPFVKERVAFLEEDTHAILMDNEHLAHATRIACTVGGACGLAAIFNAPFGGLLYMFEEVTSMNWPLELTFRVFVATMVCSLVSCALCNFIGMDISQFVIYVLKPQTKSWEWNDIPIFMVLALILGVLTSLHTRALLAFTRFRQIIKKYMRGRQPFASILETAGYAAVCALACSLVSLLSHCQQRGEPDLEYVQFNCPEGQYNPVASLLITTSHSAVKLLYSGNDAGEGDLPCILAFVVYSLLNVGLGGLPVPGGAFTATMLMGGLFGRSFGVICRGMGLTHTDNGIHAVVGSAAMLCGFKQMTLASVLVVVECVNDLSLAPVVMLAVTISMSVNWSMNKHGYDEDVILSKKLPFMEGEAPPTLDGMIALDLCDPLPSYAVLRPEATVDAIKQALKEDQLNYFPIRDGDSGPCIGIVTRLHLKSMLDSAANRPSAVKTSVTSAKMIADLEAPYQEISGCPVSSSNPQDRASSKQGTDKVQLHRVMDPTPFVVVEDMPAPRLYSLFAKAGERASCVSNIRGELRGVISREGLIAAARKKPDRSRIIAQARAKQSKEQSDPEKGNLQKKTLSGDLGSGKVQGA